MQAVLSDDKSSDSQNGANCRISSTVQGRQ